MLIVIKQTIGVINKKLVHLNAPACSRQKFRNAESKAKSTRAHSVQFNRGRVPIYDLQTKEAKMAKVLWVICSNLMHRPLPVDELCDK